MSGREALGDQFGSSDQPPTPPDVRMFGNMEDTSDMWFRLPPITQNDEGNGDGGKASGSGTGFRPGDTEQNVGDMRYMTPPAGPPGSPIYYHTGADSPP